MEPNCADLGMGHGDRVSSCTALGQGTPGAAWSWATRRSYTTNCFLRLRGVEKTRLRKRKIDKGHKGKAQFSSRLGGKTEACRI